MLPVPPRTSLRDNLRCFIAAGVIGATVAGTAGLIMTGGATATVIKDPAVNNRFPYAAAIAIGTALVAVGW